MRRMRKNDMRILLFMMVGLCMLLSGCKEEDGTEVANPFFLYDNLPFLNNGLKSSNGSGTSFLQGLWTVNGEVADSCLLGITENVIDLTTLPYTALTRMALNKKGSEGNLWVENTLYSMRYVLAGYSSDTFYLNVFPEEMSCPVNDNGTSCTLRLVFDSVGYSVLNLSQHSFGIKIFVRQIIVERSDQTITRDFDPMIELTCLADYK